MRQNIKRTSLQYRFFILFLYIYAEMPHEFIYLNKLLTFHIYSYFSNVLSKKYKNILGNKGLVFSGIAKNNTKILLSSNKRGSGCLKSKWIQSHKGYFSFNAFSNANELS